MVNRNILNPYPRLEFATLTYETLEISIILISKRKGNPLMYACKMTLTYLINIIQFTLYAILNSLFIRDNESEIHKNITDHLHIMQFAWSPDDLSCMGFLCYLFICSCLQIQN